MRLAAVILILLAALPAGTLRDLPAPRELRREEEPRVPAPATLREAALTGHAHWPRISRSSCSRNPATGEGGGGAPGPRSLSAAIAAAVSASSSA